MFSKDVHKCNNFNGFYATGLFLDKVTSSGTTTSKTQENLTQREIKKEIFAERENQWG